MKKLIALCAFCLSALISTAQLTTTYAYKVITGTPIKSGGVRWDEPEDCDIKIEFGKSNAIVHAQKTHLYRAIESIDDDENSQTWSAIDDDGDKCTITLGYSEDAMSGYFMIIYTNIVVFYYTQD